MTVAWDRATEAFEAQRGRPPDLDRPADLKAFAKLHALFVSEESTAAGRGVSRFLREHNRAPDPDSEADVIELVRMGREEYFRSEEFHVPVADALSELVRDTARDGFRREYGREPSDAELAELSRALWDRGRVPLLSKLYDLLGGSDE